MKLLIDAYPAIYAEIHPTRNKSLPVSLSSGSGRKIWWLGDCGHEWEASVDNRVRGRGCPYCSGNKVLKGFNDLTTTHPGLIEEWDFNKNTLPPENFSVGSKTKVFWLCEKKHGWEAVISSRTLGRGCPYCSGNKVLKGFNDLTTTHPDISSLWSSENLEPAENFSAGSNKKMLWFDKKCGHQWERQIAKQVKSSGCPICINRKVVLGVNDLATTHPEIFQKLANQVQTNISYGSRSSLNWECEKGHVWSARTHNISRGQWCPKCVGTVSKPEVEIAEYLRSFGLVVETQVKNVLPGRHSLDIFLPQKNIAIEYNGLYWHSEDFRSKNYHYTKWKECQELGIQLIQIWEDDWITKSEIIKTMLAHKIGVSSKKKIYGRETVPSVISSGEAFKFLNNYHVQGSARGSFYVGLKDKKDDELVAVMVFIKQDALFSKATLVRYATSCVVIGGFSKLLKFAIANNSFREIVTFADLTVSDGSLYEKNGFFVDKVLPPDYSYLVNKTRVHKFSYRLKRFKNDPALQYEEGLSERELALLNGLPRIWDAGKIRYVKRVI